MDKQVFCSGTEWWLPWVTEETGDV